MFQEEALQVLQQRNMSMKMRHIVYEFNVAT